MNDLMIWTVLALIVLGLVILGITVFVTKEKPKPNYYTMFIIGLIWLPLGLPLKNYAFTILGLVFMGIGLVNKDKWEENKKEMKWENMSDSQKKLKKVLFLFLGIMVLVGLVVYYLYAK